ncbi:hypothetical protein [Marinoscillum furvescens]|uniref:Uncharacterized protein n=1 Tax=Marinoscillum furvescens DSM 4134 TaxID=1122208 RepID=A0A3D9KYZ6_MARFU|nr:hypothetical protein [Marinoscillum furvescens]RED94103.1 hypothetical protein C7460_12244 [Marinoscillum furvescens DSM 4134]
MEQARNNLSIIVVIILLSSMAACSPGKPVDREAVKEEMASREFKRLTKAELMAGAETVSRKVVHSARNQFDTDGPLGVVQLADSLEASISRLLVTDQHFENSLHKEALPVWEAYSYAPEAADIHIQELTSGYFLVTEPIKNCTDSTALCGIWQILLPKKIVIEQL